MELIAGLIIGGLLVFFGTMLGVSIERTKNQSHVFNQYVSSPADGSLSPSDIYRSTKQAIDNQYDDTPESARRQD